MIDTKQSIASRLKTLEPRISELQDDSHLRVGHADSYGSDHCSVLIVSTLFRDTPHLERQHTVKGLLQDLLPDGLVHASSIKALTPEEYLN